MAGTAGDQLFRQQMDRMPDAFIIIRSTEIHERFNSPVSAKQHDHIYPSHQIVISAAL